MGYTSISVSEIVNNNSSETRNFTEQELVLFKTSRQSVNSVEQLGRSLRKWEVSVSNLAHSQHFISLSFKHLKQG